MKKVSLWMTVGLLVIVLAGCNSSESKVSELKEESQESQLVTVTDKRDELEEIKVSEDVYHQWTTDVKVTEGQDGSLEVVYHLTSNDGKSEFEFIEKPGFRKDWYEMFTEAGAQIYEMVDYNFDGHLDFRSQQYGAMVNQYYNIRLWDPQLGEFVLSQDYMSMPNPVVNSENEEILSRNYDRGLPNYKLYNIIDGQPVVIAFIDVVFKDDGSYEFSETVGDETRVMRNLSEVNSIWTSFLEYIID